MGNSGWGIWTHENVNSKKINKLYEKLKRAHHRYDKLIYLKNNIKENKMEYNEIIKKFEDMFETLQGKIIEVLKKEPSWIIKRKRFSIGNTTLMQSDDDLILVYRDEDDKEYHRLLKINRINGEIYTYENLEGLLKKGLELELDDYGRLLFSNKRRLTEY